MTLESMKRGVAGIALLVMPALAGATDLPFLTATVERQTLMQERMVDGRVEAVRRSTISAQTSGRVLEINYDVDDFVEQGALVLGLSDSEQRARVRAAEGSLSEARTRFQEARSEFDRIETIFADGLVSQTEFDRARAARDSARARVESAEASLAEAREQLGYTEVVAPFAGILTERHVEVGESVSPGTPLITGTSLDQLRVEINVPQRLIHHLRRYREAHVVLDTGERIEVESLTIFPYADPAANTFRVRLNLPETERDLGLFPGMLVKAAVKLGEDRRLVVPSEAVVFRSEVVAVYTVDQEGRVGFRQIRVGRELPEGFEVLAGLREGEQIALDPVHAGIYLKETQQVSR
ncbi:efflux RND transporter periplasmic adaptor subunit [Thioalkalivibrio paradoxus]|uniref:RND transporter n=1 Tax=Thioalkalivibrio paradoxus ARh 1 TaxID=713585 RepID=W0DK68_9GAMM|nr:efflux RND transporter periplasmic adaptor subunit [Thioalkalivibrio paradoxus]AHE97388.1 RND transporter [Thioalkalivibrio paradoxus ARh 1]